MDDSKLRALQLKQTEMMQSVHDVCVNNDIRYYMIAGTALGARRHGGFIPWDIDIDIAMPREDYERFQTEVSRKLPKGLTCMSHLSGKGFISPHMLIVLDGSKLVQRTDYLNPQIKRFGVFIDVFPLDHCPNDVKLQRKQAKALRFVTKLKHRKLSIINEQDDKVIKFLKRLIRIFFSFVSMSSILKKQQKIMQEYNTLPNDRFWCSMSSHYSYEKQRMPKEYYGEPTLYSFENKMFYGPQMLDEYLSKLYGDYMKLPSKEQQDWMKSYFVDAKW